MKTTEKVIPATAPHTAPPVFTRFDRIPRRKNETTGDAITLDILPSFSSAVSP